MGIYYILIGILVRLKMRGELMVIVVRRVVRVFLQQFMDCLEKRCVLMIGGCLFDYLLVLMEILGMLLVRIDVAVVD